MEHGLVAVVRLLDEFGARVQMNDPYLAARVRHVELGAPDSGHPRSDILYFLDEGDLEDRSLLDLPANYLAVTPSASIDVVGRPCNLVTTHTGTFRKTLQIVNDCLEALERLDEYSLDLLTCVVDNPDLDTAVEVVARVMGNPVALLDERYVTIARSKHERTGDALWDSVVHDGIVPTDELSWEYTNLPLSAADGDFLEPVIVTSTEKRRIITEIRSGESSRTRMLVLEQDRPLRRMDTWLAEQLGGAISGLLHSGARYDSVPLFFDDIVSDNTIDDSGAAERARGLGLGTPDEGRLILVSREPQTLADTLGLVTKLNSRLPTGAQAFAYRSNPLVYLASSDGFDEALRVIRREAGGCRLGVSLPISAFSDLARAWHECRFALEAGRALMPQELLHRYEDYLITDFMQRSFERPEGSWGIHPTVSRIVEYDRKCDTLYGETLLAYLRCYRSRIATAERLCIHANTVAYRIGRIEALFGVDFEDLVSLRNMELSLEILEARKVPRLS